MGIAAKTSSGRTPLHCAASSGSPTVVELLVNWRAHLESSTIAGDTALHIAVREGHAEVVRFLLQCSADVQATNCRGDSPQVTASAMEWLSPAFKDISRMILLDAF